MTSIETAVIDFINMHRGLRDAHLLLPDAEVVKVSRFHVEGLFKKNTCHGYHYRNYRVPLTQMCCPTAGNLCYYNSTRQYTGKDPGYQQIIVLEPPIKLTNTSKVYEYLEFVVQHEPTLLLKNIGDTSLSRIGVSILPPFIAIYMQEKAFSDCEDEETTTTSTSTFPPFPHNTLSNFNKHTVALLHWINEVRQQGIKDQLNIAYQLTVTSYFHGKDAVIRGAECPETAFAWSEKVEGSPIYSGCCEAACANLKPKELFENQDLGTTIAYGEFISDTTDFNFFELSRSSLYDDIRRDPDLKYAGGAVEYDPDNNRFIVTVYLSTSGEDHELIDIYIPNAIFPQVDTISCLDKDEATQTVESYISDIRDQYNVPHLIPSEQLFQASIYHVYDLLYGSTQTCVDYLDAWGDSSYFPDSSYIPATWYTCCFAPFNGVCPNRQLTFIQETEYSGCHEFVVDSVYEILDTNGTSIVDAIKSKINLRPQSVEMLSAETSVYFGVASNRRFTSVFLCEIHEDKKNNHTLCGTTTSTTTQPMKAGAYEQYQVLQCILVALIVRIFS